VVDLASAYIIVHLLPLGRKRNLKRGRTYKSIMSIKHQPWAVLEPINLSLRIKDNGVILKSNHHICQAAYIKIIHWT
jgi:hypothetical protein